MSQSEANGARDCTAFRGVVEMVNMNLKRNKLIKNVWNHSKIQSQERFLFFKYLKCIIIQLSLVENDLVRRRMHTFSGGNS